MDDFGAPETADTELISLTRDGSVFAKVDADFAEELRRYKWLRHSCGKGKVYARTHYRKSQREDGQIYMHRLIAKRFLGDAPTPKHVVDHINGDGLDNRRENLRWLDGFENRWTYARHKQ